MLGGFHSSRPANYSLVYTHSDFLRASQNSIVYLESHKVLRYRQSRTLLGGQGGFRASRKPRLATRLVGLYPSAVHFTKTSLHAKFEVGCYSY